MIAFNGLDLVLLLALFLAVYGCFYFAGMSRWEYRRGWFAGHQHATRRLLDSAFPGCYPDVTRTSQPAEPYDWERDGL